ncbi:MAG: phage integrase SAM-like domain-containing protein [Bacteroidales bacterium]|nr:phage integrase SAM-like domain-containing protein [Bacteroidales bacterium]
MFIYFERAFAEFLDSRQISEQRRRLYVSLSNTFGRYLHYRSLSHKMNSFSSATIQEFAHYLKNENAIMIGNGMLRKGMKTYLRGVNTVNDLMRKLRTFFRWCEDRGYIKSSPFANYHICSDLYGTPYYLTLEERKRLERLDLAGDDFLARQRDVFIFQCCIGCRYGDLIRLSAQNINSMNIEYIASKTRNGSTKIIRIPLNVTAMSIVERYQNANGTMLLPFVSLPRYNRAIRKLLKSAGILRCVSVADSITRLERKVPICEVAGSHLARRTFIGNLYKNIKDPSIISSMTGHTEGSRAFSRYRAIDDDIKRETVALLD